MVQKSLYNPEDFKDSCGFGLIVQMDNKPSHWLVETAVNSLARLSHRGAITADGKTGDGCGILLSKPDGFLRAVAKEAGIQLAPLYAVGSIFLNPNKLFATNSIARLTKELRQEGLDLAWERLVPTNPEACGEAALKTMPTLMQVFINAPSEMSEEEFERKLYIARRRTELALADKFPVFYVASLSSKVLSYKGMLLPKNLFAFFPDLADERMSSSMCLYHQRFSTNTMPQWKLAQPFRILAHNGEINSLRGNRNWSISRESKYSSPLIPNFHELLPLVSKDGSDSMSLDNMLEGVIMTGVDFLQAVRILVPQAWQNDKHIDPDLRAFYEYYSLHLEPWDGPAGLVLTDGRYGACAMDRNGLRPARYVITKDRYFTVASEIGVYDYKPEDVIAKGRLKPGEMLAVDTQTGELLLPDAINKRLIAKNPYKEWLKKYTRYLKPAPEEEEPGCDPFFPNEFKIYEKQFLFTAEERNYVLASLAEIGEELTISMGDDTPLAVLSREVRSPYEYFRQQFAQVTNPPIDPVREKLVMSLKTCLGKEVNPFVDEPENAIRIEIDSPILSRSMFKALLQPDDTNFTYETIDLTYPRESNLQTALQKICDKAERAARDGKIFLILTDRRLQRNRIPIHALFAVGAVNARLCQKGLRCDVNIIVETATTRDPHHYAALLGFGATCIYPYFAYQALYDMAQAGQVSAINSEQINTVQLMQKYRNGIEKGLYKILSKMGISTLNSYRGAQLFEAIGLHEEVMEFCFPGTPSRIQGATFADMEEDQRILSAQAWDSTQIVSSGGLMKYNPRGEYHAFNPDVVMSLQNATRTNSLSEYQRFADLVNTRPITALRDMLKLKPNKEAISIDQVETAESILPRFAVSAMSLGALSPEAHEAIAIAMNKIGGKSNSGEGGEDPCRYGTDKNSKVKQIASGRFGVTPEYLMSAEELQIKIAQGAKPGEGGQLPGFKVNELIARLRYTRPGTTLISPPPHHDIYSIEDLAQLIFDLKQINPKAQVSVKLVAESGIGTIAAGVAKTYADAIIIAGYDGGTGASPQTSIRYAGIPWELGLVESHLALKANDLRDKVKIQVDGGLKTGLDVIKAAILGAESFGFATAPLITLGCKYLRICHLNTCATGVATQNPTLRSKHFKGLPELLENYFRFVAEEIREWLAYLGAKNLNEIIGRSELLEIIAGQTKKQRNLYLDIILDSPEELSGKADYCLHASNEPYDKGLLAEEMVKDAITAIKNKTATNFSYKIQNINRSIGARISGEVAKLHGDQGLSDSPITFNFTGTAGQSFGVWNAGGVNLILEGDANDYVGKGMAGGQIIIYPPSSSNFNSNEASIIGNTCLYGATGGVFMAAGQAGERFAVRNSGSIAIVEGLGDHGCEYMTGGIVVVLGKTGVNFGAGMTGGFAFILDENNDFNKKYNEELVEILRINREAMPEQANDYANYLKELISNFVTATHSKWAQSILDNYEDKLKQFWLVKPKAVNLNTIYDYKQQSISRIRANRT